jgi:hypothetical protein
MGEGSSSCLAAPHLLRARHARPLPSLRGFSFRFATPYSHLHLREDHGLPVLGPCLPLPFPRRPLMSITRDPPAHQLGRGLSSPSGDTAMRYTLSSCTPLPCTLSPCTALPTARLALASALPRRRSLRGRPCQVTAVRDLVALRASRSRATTPHLHPRTPEPRAALARIALLLTRLLHASRTPAQRLRQPQRAPAPPVPSRSSPSKPGAVPWCRLRAPVPPRAVACLCWCPRAVACARSTPAEPPPRAAPPCARPVHMRAAGSRVPLCVHAPEPRQRPWLRRSPTPLSLCAPARLAPTEPSPLLRRLAPARACPRRAPLAPSRAAPRAPEAAPECSCGRRSGPTPGRLGRCRRLCCAVCLRHRGRNTPFRHRQLRLEEREGKKKAGIGMEPGPVGKRIKAPGIREQRRRGKEISQGLMRNFRKLQGLICKAKFPIDLKP